MDHRAVRGLAAGAALDDLDPAERATLDAHLDACEPCRVEARALFDVSGILALAAPVRQPPASLRGDVLAAIAASERRPAAIPALAHAGTPATISSAAAVSLPVSALPSPSAGDASAARRAEADAAVVDIEALRRERAGWRRLSFAGLAAAAVLAVAVVGLGAANGSLRSDLAATQRERDAVTAQAAAAAAERDAAAARLAATDGAMSVVLAPDHATAALTPDDIAAGAHVYVVYRPGTTEAWLMAGDLPATPHDRVYQLWWADERGAHALATFSCDGSSPCVAPFGVDLGAATATMITLEPEGGATGTPGPQVAFGELQG